jgi:outer membrane biosynthesis protein TonB
MTQKIPKDWTSPDGRWQWNGQHWSPRQPPKPSPLARVMALPPNRRNLILLATPIAALMLLTFTVAVASGSPPAATPEVAVATTATPTVEPTATPTQTAKPTPTPTATPSPTATPAPPPAAAPAPPPVPAVRDPAPRVAAPAPPPPVAAPVPPPPAAQPPAADPYAAATAAGASAVCADGSWSFSKTRSGTCSHHGGVHWWTGNLGPPGPGGH